MVFLSCKAEASGQLITSADQVTRKFMQAFNEIMVASQALDAERYFRLFEREEFVGLNSRGENWRSIADLEASMEKVEALNLFGELNDNHA